MGFGKRMKRIAKKTAKTGLKVATSKAGMMALGAVTGGGAVAGLEALKQSGLADTALSAMSKNSSAGAALGLAGASLSAPGYANVIENVRNVKHVVDDEIEDSAAHAAHAALGAASGAVVGAGDGLIGAIKKILFGGN